MVQGIIAAVCSYVLCVFLISYIIHEQNRKVDPVYPGATRKKQAFKPFGPNARFSPRMRFFLVVFAPLGLIVLIFCFSLFWLRRWVLTYSDYLDGHES